jgi:hypothetical protein
MRILIVILAMISAVVVKAETSFQDHVPNTVRPITAGHPESKSPTEQKKELESNDIKKALEEEKNSASFIRRSTFVRGCEAKLAIRDRALSYSKKFVKAKLPHSDYVEFVSALKEIISDKEFLPDESNDWKLRKEND